MQVEIRPGAAQNQLAELEQSTHPPSATAKCLSWSFVCCSIAVSTVVVYEWRDWTSSGAQR